MGWLDKTFKNIIKSPLGKAALAGGLAMTPWGQAGIARLMTNPNVLKGAGALSKLWAKPLISKPLTSAGMSYGLAKLMRARNPEKAAMWGALTTLPFLGASSMKHAKALTDAGQKTSMWDVLLNKPKIADIYSKPGSLLAKNFKDLTNSEKMSLANLYRGSDATSFPGRINALTQANIDKFAQAQLAKTPSMVGAAKDYSYFMKSPIELKAMEKAAANASGLAQFMPHSNWSLARTGIPLMGALYGGREYDYQKWERIKNERRKQLAWMYGVSPDEIEGEMDNPFYNIDPPALDWKYANRGGIMELPTGGAISGPGTGTSDSINARVSNGEFIFTDKSIENLGGGDHTEGTKIAYSIMNQLDPQSQTAAEGMV